MNRIRWLILIVGPLPIIGSSWAVSAWLKSEPRVAVMRNSVLPATAGESPAPSKPPRRSDGGSAALADACDQAADKLRGALGPPCNVVVRSPFVLGGDLSGDRLEALYAETIAPAVRAMHHSYFDAPPNAPVTVLVFRGEESYNRYCEALFADRAISIYGYYKPKQRTLVMNIATGNGTLLHELTHALVAFDFPGVPDWLNEGLASLHEQSRFRTGTEGPWIEGLVNWRLPGLQEVVRAGELGTLEELATNPRFRGPGEGTNYAQARYFCLYMQQQGVLADYYRAFRENQSRDPHGLKTLSAVFPGIAADELDKDFERFVLSLDAGP